LENYGAGSSDAVAEGVERLLRGLKALV